MNKLKLLLSLVISMMSFASYAGEQTCTVSKRFNVSIEDQGRMSRLETSRSLGLAAALVNNSGADRAVISELFINGFAPINSMDALIGAYQCRTIKLGGISPAIIYGWFSCEIFPEEAALVIRKTSGSQRFLGFFSEAGNGLAYKGALSYGYEDQMKLYGQDNERNQVGCLSAVSPDMNHLVLELPEPVFESFHDVIELKR